MRPRRRILCDLDSIAADINKSWLDLYNKAFSDELTPHKFTEWDIHKFVKPECGPKIYSFIDTHAFFYTLDPLPGAIEALTAIHNQVDENGEKVNDLVIVTAAEKPLHVVDKWHWINKHLPFIDRKHMFFGRSKHMIRGDVFIDDAPHQIREFKSENPASQIMTIAWPYNKSVESLCSLRAEGWEDTAAAWKMILLFLGVRNA